MGNLTCRIFIVPLIVRRHHAVVIVRHVAVDINLTD